MRRGLIAAATFVCMLSACSDTAESEAEPTPATSSSPSATTSPSPTPSETAPAGELITTDAVSLRAPVTWTVEESDAGTGQGFSIFSPSGAAGGSITVYISPNSSSYTLKDAEDFAIEEMRGVLDPRARRLARTAMGGQPAYHVRGKDEIGNHDWFGAIHDGHEINLNFELRGTKAERQSIIDEVLTSVEWK